MGWSTGTEIFDRIIQILSDKVDDTEVREDLYTDLIPLFEDFDCDNIEELLGEDAAFDRAYKSLLRKEIDEYEEEEMDGA